MDRIKITLSLPAKYEDKFINLIHNINALNENSAYVKIEETTGKKKVIQYDKDTVAFPKE